MSNLPANIVGLADALVETKKSIAAYSPGNGPYLRFVKGLWLFGQEDTEVSPDDLWVANPASIEKGFISWGKGEDQGKKMGEEMASIQDNPVVKSQLPEVGYPWDQQIGIQLVCIEGLHEGVGVYFKTSSYGGIKAMDNFITALHAQIIDQNKKGGDTIVPVLELKKSSYKHKAHGTVYEPLLEITEWASLSEGIHEMPEVEDDEDDDTPEPPAPEPARTRTRTAKAEAKPEPEIIDQEPETVEEAEAQPEVAGRRRRRVTR